MLPNFFSIRFIFVLALLSATLSVVSCVGENSIGCNENSECGEGNICMSSTCFQLCDSSLECDLGFVCSDNVCVRSEGQDDNAPRIATRLKLVGPQTITAGQCASYSVSMVDEEGEPAILVWENSVDLSATQGAQFFSDSSCETPLSEIPVHAGQSRIRVYLLDAEAEEIELNAKMPTLENAILAVSVVALSLVGDENSPPTTDPNPPSLGLTCDADSEFTDPMGNGRLLLTDDSVASIGVADSVTFSAVCVKDEAQLNICRSGQVITLNVTGNDPVVIGGRGMGSVTGQEAIVHLNVQGSGAVFVLMDTTEAPMTIHVVAPNAAVTIASRGTHRLTASGISGGAMTIVSSGDLTIGNISSGGDMYLGGGGSLPPAPDCE